MGVRDSNPGLRGTLSRATRGSVLPATFSPAVPIAPARPPLGNEKMSVREGRHCELHTDSRAGATQRAVHHAEARAPKSRSRPWVLGRRGACGRSLVASSVPGECDTRVRRVRLHGDRTSRPACVRRQRAGRPVPRVRATGAGGAVGSTRHGRSLPAPGSRCSHERGHPARGGGWARRGDIRAGTAPRTIGMGGPRGGRHDCTARGYRLLADVSLCRSGSGVAHRVRVGPRALRRIATAALGVPRRRCSGVRCSRGP
jgi:hypothetical protein